LVVVVASLKPLPYSTSSRVKTSQSIQVTSNLFRKQKLRVPVASIMYIFLEREGMYRSPEQGFLSISHCKDVPLAGRLPKKFSNLLRSDLPLSVQKTILPRELITVRRLEIKRPEASRGIVFNLNNQKVMFIVNDV
jgi:hypothetical protein